MQQKEIYPRAGKFLDFTEIFLFFVACPLAKSMDFW